MRLSKDFLAGFAGAILGMCFVYATVQCVEFFKGIDSHMFKTEQEITLLKAGEKSNSKHLWSNYEKNYSRITEVLDSLDESEGSLDKKINSLGDNLSDLENTVAALERGIDTFMKAVLSLEFPVTQIKDNTRYIDFAKGYDLIKKVEEPEENKSAKEKGEK